MKNVWWCNQRRSWPVERAASVVCSSEHADNLAFRQTVQQVSPGDNIIHYVAKQVVAVSLAKSYGQHYARLPLVGEVDYKAGWRVEVEYFVFYPTIPKEDFVELLLGIRHKTEKGFPIDKNGNVRQGYLFPFTTEGLNIVRESSETVWPTWAWDSRAGSKI